MPLITIETRSAATRLVGDTANQKVAIGGTYVVNPDCTSSAALNVPSLDATVHADFVIHHDGAEIRAISTDSGVIESRVYRKQFREDRKQE